MRRYSTVLRRRGFRLLWTGATISALGDGLSWVALVWLVYDLTGSAGGIGALVAAYTAPVLVGGPLAGVALDRFDRRRLLIADNILRSGVMAAVPLLSYAGALRPWHLYVVAATYGLLKMIPLAGIPSLIPDLVDDDELEAANALESVSFTLGNVGGPAAAGALIAVIGGENVLALDAATYALFALALWRMPPVSPSQKAAAAPVRFSAVRLVLRNRVLLATTLMFMLINVGEGILAVVLPIYAVEVLHGGAPLYGALVSVGAAAGLVGALAAGALASRFRLARAIGLAETAAGVTLAALVLRPAAVATAVILAIAYGLLGTLTVWAQTIRMRIVPPELRGRIFALLRTSMQATPPAGALIAAPLLAGGVVLAAAAAAAVVAIPGIAGLASGALSDDRPA